MAFNFLNKLGGNVMDKLEGKSKEVLEGLAAAGALMASADGNASEQEYDDTLDILLKNPIIESAFAGKDHEVKGALSRMWDIAKTNRRSDRDRLFDEISQAVGKVPTCGRAIALTAADVGFSDPPLGEQETATYMKICKTAKISESEAREIIA